MAPGGQPQPEHSNILERGQENKHPVFFLSDCQTSKSIRWQRWREPSECSSDPMKREARTPPPQHLRLINSLYSFLLLQLLPFLLLPLLLPCFLSSSLLFLFTPPYKHIPTQGKLCHPCHHCFISRVLNLVRV